MTLLAEQFLTSTLKSRPIGGKIARILAAAIAGVDPSLLVKRNLALTGSMLELQDDRIDLDDYQHIYLLGIGKAAHSMTLTGAELLGDRGTRGFILAKHEHPPLPNPYRQRLIEYTGGHPLPNLAGKQAAESILKEISDLSENDLVLVLLSGGGSALFTLPQPDLSLQDLITTNQLLLDSGADINQINTIRKHLSQVKGGRLARALHPAKTITLILSDVPGDQLDCVASGPTMPDPTTFEDSLAIIDQYHLEQELPDAVLQHLRLGARGKVQETPKPGDHIFDGAIQILIGSNRDALDAGARQAVREGFNTTLHPLSLQGEAQSTGKAMARLLRGMAQSGDPLPRPACLIAGGETTVTLSQTPHPGKGGRNLELALGAVRGLAGLENSFLVSLASDGEDGITEAAGAVVSGDSLSRANTAGLIPEDHIHDHNSYAFFETLDDLLRPGPTGTNVNDLCFLFTYI
jgi:glycerate 2-kinase